MNYALYFVTESVLVASFWYGMQYGRILQYKQRSMHTKMIFDRKA